MPFPGRYITNRPGRARPIRRFDQRARAVLRVFAAKPKISEMRVAIVGAGAAGLASARHVAASGHVCEVLEATPQLGGTWRYTDEVEEDRYGYPVYSAMYQGLRLVGNRFWEILATFRTWSDIF